MRLIADHLNETDARFFARLLTLKKVYNLCERIANATDTSVFHYRIWVEQETHWELALQWYQQFQTDPQAVQAEYAKLISMQPATDQLQQSSPSKFKQNVSLPIKAAPIHFGWMTVRLIMLCCFVFMLSKLVFLFDTNFSSSTQNYPFSRIEKVFFYDYPQIATIYEQHITSLQTASDLTLDASQAIAANLRNAVASTPRWDGFANDYFVLLEQQRCSWSNFWATTAWPAAFEKIRVGEMWRLFTPCLLHNSVLHLVFNMLWVLILGGQIEQRVGRKRFVLLLCVLMIFSNTCQYLVGGWQFVGISGVISGWAAFIWMRKRLAPAENYPLDYAVIYFIAGSVLCSLLFGIYAFYAPLWGLPDFAWSIANTAHLSGMLAGLILANLPFFRQQIDAK